jgi:hypothetical protein
MTSGTLRPTHSNCTVRVLHASAVCAGGLFVSLTLLQRLRDEEWLGLAGCVLAGAFQANIQPELAVHAGHGDARRATSHEGQRAATRAERDAHARGNFWHMDRPPRAGGDAQSRVCIGKQCHSGDAQSPLSNGLDSPHSCPMFMQKQSRSSCFFCLCGLYWKTVPFCHTLLKNIATQYRL